jgi:hypothetical protein
MTVAAFFVTVIATLWSFAWVFVRLPRVAVETRTHLRLVPGAENQNRIELTVINRGSEALTICNIGLRDAVDRGGVVRDFARDHADHPDAIPHSTHDVLPCRIEGHGALRFTYMPEQLALFPSGTVVRGYTQHLNTTPAGLVVGLPNPFSLTRRAFTIPGTREPADRNRDELRIVEIPASNGIGTAKSVAKLYGCVAAGGAEIGMTSEVRGALINAATPPTKGLRDKVLHIDTEASTTSKSIPAPTTTTSSFTELQVAEIGGAASPF